MLESRKEMKKMKQIQKQEQKICNKMHMDPTKKIII